MIDLNDVEEDSFFAIQAADLRWLYGLWAQLAHKAGRWIVRRSRKDSPTCWKMPNFSESSVPS
jgi:hypothetical protein